MSRDFWAPMLQMDDLQRTMARLLGRYGEAAPPAFPPVNVYTGPEGAVITTEVPGVKQEDLVLSVLGDTVTLEGQRQRPEVREGHTFHRRERGFGPFRRTIQMPFRIDAENVVATLDRGRLEVRLQQSGADRPRAIAVTSNPGS